MGFEGSTTTTAVLGMDGFVLVGAEEIDGELVMTVETTVTKVGCPACERVHHRHRPQAGPGILRRRAVQVQAAQALRDEIAQRWSTTALSGSDWSDRLVGHCAVTLAQAMVTNAARHSEEALRADQAGASYRQRLEVRQQNQLQGRLNASRRAKALALAKPRCTDFADPKDLAVHLKGLLTWENDGAEARFPHETGGTFSEPSVAQVGPSESELR